MTNSRNQLVSIGLPVYNGEPFLRQAIESLLAQSYKNIELVISDNCSTDLTKDICLEYAVNDKRVKYYRNNINIGPIANFNKVFKLSKGNFFMWGSHDDYWAPHYIRSCIMGFNKSDKIALVGSKCNQVDSTSGCCVLTDEGLSTIDLKDDKRFKQYKLMLHNRKNVNSIFYGIFKREYLEPIMPMINVIASDHLLLAELSLQYEFLTLPSVLMFKRKGGISKSLKSIARSLEINSLLFVNFPYLIREFYLQRAILNSKNLIMLKKFELSCWSINQYAKAFFIPQIKSNILKLFIIFLSLFGKKLQINKKK